MARKRYDKFGGVDFSGDKTAIAEHRSPDALNIIADSAGFPEKRVGWRVLKNFPGRINGIYPHGEKIIIHAGSTLCDEQGSVLLTGIKDAKSFGRIFCGKLYILTGAEFLCCDGESAWHVKDRATVPQVLSQANSSLDGGFTYQPFNMLTTKRKVGITIHESAGISDVVIKQKADAATLRAYFKETGAEIPIVEVRAEDWDSDAPITRVFFDKIYYSTGAVGDEIILEYGLIAPRDEIIERCTFMAVYENRLFVGGNPDYPNCDFYSQLNDAAYFSDLAYTNIGTNLESPDEEEVRARENDSVGSGGSRILGYSYVGNYLAIHKDNPGNGASLYLRHGVLGEDGMYFPIREGIVGESLASPHTCVPLLDDPLFLTKSGVFAIDSSNLNGERAIKPRSSRVNPRLCDEEDLENACATACDGYYYLFVNGRVYVADSRQKSYARNTSGAFEYEWYYWSNVPARCCATSDGALYFGTFEGELCRFNHDMADGRGGYSMLAYNDNGEAIEAYWSTKFDDDGDFSTLKQLRRRGSGVYVKTYGKGDIKLMVRTEEDFGKQINFVRCGLFNFQSLNFRDFTFNTRPFSFVPFGRKVKNYRMIQVICKNDGINESLGILAIEWQYKRGKFAK